MTILHPNNLKMFIITYRIYAQNNTPGGHEEEVT